MPATPFLTVSEVKSFQDPTGNVVDTSADGVILATIQAVCEAIEENIRRPVVARGLTLIHDGGVRRLFVRHREPGFIQLDSVTEKGSLLTTDQYALYADTGIIIRRSGDVVQDWASGIQSVVIQYTAGVAETAETVPENLKLAAKIAVRHYLKMGPEDYGSKMDSGAWFRPDDFPKASLRLMRPYVVR